MIFIFSGPHMPIGNIWSGISFRHDNSIFVALAEPWSVSSASASGSASGWGWLLAHFSFMKAPPGWATSSAGLPSGSRFRLTEWTNQRSVQGGSIWTNPSSPDGSDLRGELPLVDGDQAAARHPAAGAGRGRGRQAAAAHPLARGDNII